MAHLYLYMVRWLLVGGPQLLYLVTGRKWYISSTRSLNTLVVFPPWIRYTEDEVMSAVLMCTENEFSLVLGLRKPCGTYALHR